MRVSLEKLLKDRIIQKVLSDKKASLQTFEIAKRDLVTAKKLFESGDNNDWCLAISYNAMLQAGRALMHLEGYKPSSENKHVAVVQFVHEGFGKEMTDRMITVFDRMRKKRHQAVYDTVHNVTVDEAEQVIQWAEEFVEKVKHILDKKMN